jgi:hypothetical protein
MVKVVKHMLRPVTRLFVALVAAALLVSESVQTPRASAAPAGGNQVLEWNQTFIDTLIATNTPNSSSQRLGAIVHTAIFDAYNGIDRRYTPIFIQNGAPRASSRRAAVIAAAHAALVGLFPSQQSALDVTYAGSLERLSERCEHRQRSCGERIQRGIQWGDEVAHAVLGWRANDGFSASYPSFTGGTAVGQWRPTAPAFGPMSAQGLAFTSTFVLTSNSQFRPHPPRALDSVTYAADFNAVKALGRRTDSTRTADQSALAVFWEGNASVHWNQAANQMARANRLSISESNRLLAVLNIAMADTAFTTWSSKRFYGADSSLVTWRPVTSIPLADTDGNSSTTADLDWLPLVTTPSHPEYAAGHPSQNGAAATVLFDHFRSGAQTFTLTTAGQPERTYHSIALARTDGNNARVWGGMHYPSTVEISDAMGEAIADYVDKHAMLSPTCRLLDVRCLSDEAMTRRGREASAGNRDRYRGGIILLGDPRHCAAVQASAGGCRR